MTTREVYVEINDATNGVNNVAEYVHIGTFYDRLEALTFIQNHGSLTFIQNHGSARGGQKNKYHIVNKISGDPTITNPNKVVNNCPRNHVVIPYDTWVDIPDSLLRIYISSEDGNVSLDNYQSKDVEEYQHKTIKVEGFSDCINIVLT